MNQQEFEEKRKAIPNTELWEMAEKQLNDLCKTGAATFTMTVPPKITDTDMVFSEVISRFKVYSQPPNLIDLENERLQWSLQTFPEATPIRCLRKAEEEIAEIEKTVMAGNPDPVEYADALMCILDSAGRAGVSVETILKAFAEKTAINKARKWAKNPDNTYSHIKQQTTE